MFARSAGRVLAVHFFRTYRQSIQEPTRATNGRSHHARSALRFDALSLSDARAALLKQMRVDFMILGAQKCGTTTLARRLASHPQLAISNPKEPHFFSTTADWRGGLAHYHGLFPANSLADPDRLCFEASTSYTFHPHRRLAIWEALRAYNPALKFIYLVRHPVERILSAYMHNVLRGAARRPPEQILLSDPLYLAVSRYYSQIRPFIETFGHDRVLILELDALTRQPETVDPALARLLGITVDGFDAVDLHENASTLGRKRPRYLDAFAPASPWLRRRAPSLHRRLSALLTPRPFLHRPVLQADIAQAIIDALTPEIDALARLMNRDLSHWRHWPAARARAAASLSTDDARRPH